MDKKLKESQNDKSKCESRDSKKPCSGEEIYIARLGYYLCWYHARLMGCQEVFRPNELQDYGIEVIL
jgi:hypothetical protein